MPMSEEVRKAVEHLDGTALAMHRDYQTIRARLVELEAENERLRTRAEKAEALLRKCRDEFTGLPHSLGYDFTHLPEITAHLSENGHG